MMKIATDLPLHWEVKPLKSLGYLYAGLNGKKGEDFSKLPKAGFSSFVPFTSVACGGLVAKNLQYVAVPAGEQQNFVSYDDLLFLMSSENFEDIAKCALYKHRVFPLYLNSFCKGFRVTDKNCIPDFINYYYQSDYCRDYFAKVARGFTRINIKQNYVRNCPTPIPTKLEQEAIANFLDDKTEKIERAIAIKEKQIELLKERKQILIQNAVTHGLNPDAPMKDSGIDWIGEIPAHWEVKKLGKMKRLLTSGSRGWAKYYADDGDMFLRMTNVTKAGVEIDLSNLRYVRLGSEKEGTRTAIQNGDILITITAELGAVAIARSNVKGAFINQHVALYRARREVCLPDYLVNFLSSNAAKTQFNLLGQGGTKQGLGFEEVNNVQVTLPPLAEQAVIAKSLQQFDRQYSSLIKMSEKQIKKLKEYKASLINSAVTGKIKVPA